MRRGRRDCARSAGPLLNALVMRRGRAVFKAARRGLAAAAAFSALPERSSALQNESPATELTAYAAPDRLVALRGGRKIHVRCMGNGSPTVVLTAGSGDWSFTWRAVQSDIARTTRVCAWDRAGMGFSDPSGRRQDVRHTLRDLEQLLAAGNIRPPYVMVGHSVGSFETLLFAFRHPSSVAGIVLIDPSHPAQDRRFSAAAPHAFGYLETIAEEELAMLRSCMHRAEVDSAGHRRRVHPDCRADADPDYPPELNAALSAADDGLAAVRARVSLITNWERSSRQVAARWRHLGSLPMTVLTAGTVPSLPAESREEGALITAEWGRMHAEIAALSSAGEHRIIGQAGHYIHIDRPDAVVAAIREAIAATRIGSDRRG